MCVYGLPQLCMPYLFHLDLLPLLAQYMGVNWYPEIRCNTMIFCPEFIGPQKTITCLYYEKTCGKCFDSYLYGSSFKGILNYFPILFIKKSNEYCICFYLNLMACSVPYFFFFFFFFTFCLFKDEVFCIHYDVFTGITQK